MKEKGFLTSFSALAYLVEMAKQSVVNDGMKVFNVTAMIGIQDTMRTHHCLEPLFTLSSIAQFKHKLGPSRVGGALCFLGNFIKLERN